MDKTFHYVVPPALISQVKPGKRVFVPFGPRKLTAYVLNIIEASDITGIKQILPILDDDPLWTDGELEFFRWVSAYYLHPLGEVLKTALPAGINQQTRKAANGKDEKISGGRKVRREAYYVPGTIELLKGSPGIKASQVLELVRTEGEVSGAELRARFGQCSAQVKRLVELGLIRREDREQFRNPFKEESVDRDTPRLLNHHQKAALEATLRALNKRVFAPFLLHGVTGSGKTEVYLQAIDHALGLGRSALVLVPEISLTPQLVRRFRARFGSGIAILHSGLSDGERYDEWRRIRRNLVRIVIGARSAIFAPLSDLGIIVVDEEHEASFKQSDGLRYNARDLALVRGRMEQATVLLGSATPLVTSLHAAEQGKLELLSLPERVHGGTMPQVEIVAMKGVKGTISPNLYSGLSETLAGQGQALVFLNRRGFSTYLVCSECGVALTCPNCSVTLTFHRQKGQSVCHYCDYAIPAPGTCPACGSLELLDLGAGTERVEHEMHELLPDARIVRMDSDTTSGRGSHSRILSRMVDATADILVGTQMITKGHDFPGVTLVGVLNAEASLNLPDFRSAERTFQVLSQVFGRAGRGETPGRVILQALNPGHYAIQHAIRHDAAAFYAEEMEFRREAGYPPFAFLICLGFSGTSEQAVEEQADISARLLLLLKRQRKHRVEILGPAPSPLYRLRGRFRRQILLKSPTRSVLRACVTAWIEKYEAVSNVRTFIDIDPVDMM